MVLCFDLRACFCWLSVLTGLYQQVFLREVSNRNPEKRGSYLQHVGSSPVLSQTFSVLRRIKFEKLSSLTHTCNPKDTITKCCITISKLLLWWTSNVSDEALNLCWEVVVCFLREKIKERRQVRNYISVMCDPEGIRHKQTVIRCKSRIPNTRLPKCHNLHVFFSFIYLRFTSI